MAKTAKKAAAPKKTKAGRSPPVDRKKYKMRLPVPVGSERVAELADALVHVIRERDAVLSQRREALSKYKQKLASYDERFKELATGVEKRVDFVEVDVVERLVVETNEVEVVRLDTGEVVETKTADATDRQEALFADGAGKANPSAKDMGEGESLT